MLQQIDLLWCRIDDNLTRRCEWTKNKSIDIGLSSNVAIYLCEVHEKSVETLFVFNERKQDHQRPLVISNDASLKRRSMRKNYGTVQKQSVEVWRCFPSLRMLPMWGECNRYARLAQLGSEGATWCGRVHVKFSGDATNCRNLPFPGLKMKKERHFKKFKIIKI